MNQPQGSSSLQCLRAVGLPLLVACVLTGCKVITPAPPRVDFDNEQPNSETIRYFPSPPESLAKIKMQSVSLSRSEREELLAVARQPSPQGTHWLVTREPNTQEPGPWSTEIFVFKHEHDPVVLKLTFTDHGNGGVRTNWLNERLLFVQAWWGRIRSTDIVFDVGNGKAIYIEDADYYRLVYGEP